ncbi:NEQ432 [Nanoarchaeum equitans Kin4-M]|uniref:NEQ432 n=1 Tax=Nanoarchaeum equitans (strain Kin4-M) TaxID=228908 RepID=Q74MX5_NANEQ|nr:NEQ432 [Nanoarchaeum equitans Kin4-M]
MKELEKLKKFFNWLLFSNDPKSYLAFIVFVFVFYNFIFTPILKFITKSENPILVILTPSMQHNNFNLLWYCKYWNLSLIECEKKFKQLPFSQGINVGDIVISTSKEDAKVGDVLVMKANLKYPLVHRVIGLRCGNKTIKDFVYIKDYKNCTLITKGDNNPTIDPFVITYKEVEGKVSFVIPYLGIPRVILYKILRI